jgi:hypothetical protein
MANYVVQLNRTASTTLPVGTVGADATRPRRIKWYDLMFGSEASPADNPFLWTVQRCTALGTSTGVTPTAVDPADVATEADAGENHTIDATQTANLILLAIALNQRATFRWVAAPGSELVTPGTASNGAALNTPTSSAVAVSATVMFCEQ